MKDDKNKIIFVHIPKTGGETITKMLWGCKLSLATGKHLTVKQYAEQCSIEDYYCFSIVRNPYERALSHYRFLKQYYNPPRIKCNFETWIQNPHGAIDFLFYPQSYYVDDTVDIFKFEDWDATIRQICKKTGFKNPNSFIHRNKTRKEEDLSLSPISIAAINDLYSEDFERFGYVKQAP
jgi:hypothetical protein